MRRGAGCGGGVLSRGGEPPVFLGTERPLTEQHIIPTTWRENGIGLFGDREVFSWRLYLMNSFDGAEFGAAGLRGGRTRGRGWFPERRPEIAEANPKHEHDYPVSPSVYTQPNSIRSRWGPMGTE